MKKMQINNWYKEITYCSEDPRHIQAMDIDQNPKLQLFRIGWNQISFVSMAILAGKQVGHLIGGKVKLLHKRTAPSQKLRSLVTLFVGGFWPETKEIVVSFLPLFRGSLRVSFDSASQGHQCCLNIGPCIITYMSCIQSFEICIMISQNAASK